MDYALSLKQPWAALVVHGRKRIEVRRWATRRQGRVLIHAARIPDPRPEAWARLPAELVSAARLVGGIVGEADLVECRTYNNRQSFALDQSLHLNELSWFQPPQLYGFVFAKQRPLPFLKCKGALYFFDVAGYPTMAGANARLLVSVRSAAEAEMALAGGADLIDVKAPERGSLGRADADAIADVVRAVGNKAPVSAALGELVEIKSAAVPPGVAFVKCGLAGTGRRSDWRQRLDRFCQLASQLAHPPEVVTVAYADWQQAGAPPWREVASYALRKRGGVLLIDTFDKSARLTGTVMRPTSLLNWMSAKEVLELAIRCRNASVRLALAGSLRLPHIHQLLHANPTWFAVRGAICDADRRDGPVNPLKVRSLAELLRWSGQQRIGGS